MRSPPGWSWLSSTRTSTSLDSLVAKTQSTRSASTYLEAFQSVRWIHDDLLGAAEETSAVVVASDDLEVTLSGVVDYLGRAIPFRDLDATSSHFQVPGMKGESTDGPRTLLLIVDGMGDEPNPALGGKTPLAAADTPTLEALAGQGGQGQVLTTHTPGKAASTNEDSWPSLGTRRPARRSVAACSRPWATAFRLHRVRWSSAGTWLRWVRTACCWTAARVGSGWRSRSAGRSHECSTAWGCGRPHLSWT